MERAWGRDDAERRRAGKDGRGSFWGVEPAGELPARLLGLRDGVKGLCRVHGMNIR